MYDICVERQQLAKQEEGKSTIEAICENREQCCILLMWLGPRALAKPNLAH